MIVQYPGASVREKMELFWHRDGLPSVANGELVSISRTADGKARWIIPNANHSSGPKPPPEHCSCT
jgi:hypothetical protein